MLIYKICDAALWQEAKHRGLFTGAPIDHADGYIHFSTIEQLADTAQKYFAGQSNLVLLTVDTNRLDAPLLKFEPARNGALFPHLYGPLLPAAVINEAPFAA